MLIALLLLSCADAIRGLYLPLVVSELFGRPQLMSYLWSIQAVFELAVHDVSRLLGDEIREQADYPLRGRLCRC
ncbi:hypothetical protein LJK88_32145 [Paenibacillus sp. P26]|nr:hypothetical protein LJK88_32145 [Paenibacillus sp. P26]